MSLNEFVKDSMLLRSVYSSVEACLPRSKELSASNTEPGSGFATPHLDFGGLLPPMGLPEPVTKQ